MKEIVVLGLCAAAAVLLGTAVYRIDRAEYATILNTPIGVAFFLVKFFGRRGGLLLGIGFLFLVASFMFDYYKLDTLREKSDENGYHKFFVIKACMYILGVVGSGFDPTGGCVSAYAGGIVGLVAINVCQIIPYLNCLQ